MFSPQRTQHCTFTGSDLNLTFIFFKVILTWTVRLTCISTHDRCATSSLSNERLRNLLRILLQQSRRDAESRQRGTGGGGEGEKSCRKIRNESAFLKTHLGFQLKFCLVCFLFVATSKISNLSYNALLELLYNTL